MNQITLNYCNQIQMKQLETSRYKQFIDIEKSYLEALPPQPYELKEYKKAKVQKMGFVYLYEDKNYYSVPFRYIGDLLLRKIDELLLRKIEDCKLLLTEPHIWLGIIAYQIVIYKLG